MVEKNFELKVGIFTFIGIVVLFIIIFSIGEVYVFKSGYNLRIVFSFANGITEAAPVRVAGVEVGEVEDINIFYDKEAKKSRVEILVWIKEDTQIEKDARACINTLGLLGEKYLEILPGSREAGLLAGGNTLIGEDPVIMDDLTKNMKELADSAKVVMSRLQSGEGTIGKLLTEEKIYNDLEIFVEDIKNHPWKLLHKTKEKKKERDKK